MRLSLIAATSLSGIGGVARPGIVHRLDKDTSGLMVAQRRTRRIEGFPRNSPITGGRAICAANISRSCGASPALAPGASRRRSRGAPRRASRWRFCPLADGLQLQLRDGAHVSHYPAAKEKGNKPLSLSIVRCSLETGRTHQVRVHLAHLGTLSWATRSMAPASGPRPMRSPGRRRRSSRAWEDRLCMPLAYGSAIRFPENLAFEFGLPTDIANLCKALESLVTKLSKN